MSPKIEIDRKDITINYGEVFKEPKYMAMYMDTDVTKQVEKSGKVDSSKLGDYKLEYEIHHSIFEDKKIVRVLAEIIGF